jgi:hypothetical protein
LAKKKKSKKTKKRAGASNTDWLDKLRAAVNKRPLAIFRFSLEEWEAVLASRDGANRFTVTYPHDMLEKVRPRRPALSLRRSVILATVATLRA